MRTMRLVSLLVLTVCAALGACGSTSKATSDQVFRPPTGPYGWAHTFTPGTVFTDGFTVLEISGGPVRIVTIDVQQAGTAATVIGVEIRPLGGEIQQFEGTVGFPPKDPGASAGAVPAMGAVLDGPTPGSAHADYELLVGYRIGPAGTYHRDRIVITYEYQAHRSTVTEPSEIDLCVGAGAQDPPCTPHENTG